MTNQTFCHRFFYAEDRHQVPAGKSIWFRGNSFFSYGTVVAQIITGLDGNPYTLVSDHRMSPTTGKHLALIKSASPYPVIHVPMRYGASRFDVSMIENRLTAKLDFLATLKMSQKPNRDAYSRAFEELETAARLLVKIKKSVLNKYRELYTQINDPERIAKEKRRSREAAAKQHQKLKKELEKLIKARNIAELAELAYGHSLEIGVDMRKKLRKLINPTGELAFAWREGSNYRTSKGISVPAREVERVARVFKAGLLRHGDKLSHYTVCSITDKAVKIGCHLIPMDNIHCLIG